MQCIDVLYSYLVLPRSTLHFINIAAPLVPIAMLVAISIAESFGGMLPKFFVDVSKRFNDITFVRELAAIIIALTIGLSNVIDMVCRTHTHTYIHAHMHTLVLRTIRREACSSPSIDLSPWQFFFVTFMRTEHIVSESEFNVTAGLAPAEHLLPESFVEQMRDAVPAGSILFPSYLSNFSVLILIAIAVIAQLTHLTKILLLLSIAGE